MLSPTASSVSALLVYSILAVSILITSFISGILGMAGGMILRGYCWR